MVFRSAVVAVVAVAMLAPYGQAMHGPSEGVSGVVPIGLGNLEVREGVDWVHVAIPAQATGFNIDGAVHYLFYRVCLGDLCAYHMHVYAPLGGVAVPFMIEWVHHGAAEVAVTGPGGTDCGDPHCLL